MQNGLFYLNSLLFGVGLAVDAFLVALVNGMNGGVNGRRQAVLTGGTFCVFQFCAAMLGWVIAGAAVGLNAEIERYLAWAAVCVIVFLGVRMLVKSARKDEEVAPVVGIGAVLAESAATSVDALTVGFTVEEYGAAAAAVCSAIIAATTFLMYLAGYAVGRRFGTKLNSAASIIGGIVFLAIAVEIIVTTYVG